MPQKGLGPSEPVRLGERSRCATVRRDSRQRCGTRTVFLRCTAFASCPSARASFSNSRMRLRQKRECTHKSEREWRPKNSKQGCHSRRRWSREGGGAAHRLHSVILPPKSFSRRRACSGSCSRSTVRIPDLRAHTRAGGESRASRQCQAACGSWSGA